MMIRNVARSWQRRGCHAESPWTGRGAAAAATWIFRGSSAGIFHDATESGLYVVREAVDVSDRYDTDFPEDGPDGRRLGLAAKTDDPKYRRRARRFRGRVAATPRPRRGYAVETRPWRLGRDRRTPQVPRHRHAGLDAAARGGLVHVVLGPRRLRVRIHVRRRLEGLRGRAERPRRGRRAVRGGVEISTRREYRPAPSFQRRNSEHERNAPAGTCWASARATTAAPVPRARTPATEK